MNKEEILAKSRNENKNRDIAELDRAKSASRFSLAFSLCFIMIYTLLTIIATGHVNIGVLATEFSLVFSMFLYKAFKSRSASDIICAVCIGCSFFMTTFAAMDEMFHIRH